MFFYVKPYFEFFWHFFPIIFLFSYFFIFFLGFLQILSEQDLILCFKIFFPPFQLTQLFVWFNEFLLLLFQLMILKLFIFFYFGFLFHFFNYKCRGFFSPGESCKVKFLEFFSFNLVLPLLLFILFFSFGDFLFFFKQNNHWNFLNVDRLRR